MAGSGAVVNTSAFKATKATNASELIIRACSKLALDNTTSIIAQECAQKVADNHVAAGRSPLSITGACIYLVANIMGHSKSAKEIGRAVDVSDGTIRTAYKLLYASRNIITDEDWAKRGADLSKIPTT
jgi:transcription initiation factor TFIIB